MLRFLSLCALVAVTCAQTGKVVDFEGIISHVNSAKSTWTAGHNFHPHTPRSYFEKLMGAKKRSDLKEKPLGKTYNDYSDIPESFDARDKWTNCPSFSHIRDQGVCGSCWAVAAASALSDRMCVFTNGTRTDELSAEELISCCFFCGLGCNGGHPDSAWVYFELVGLVTGGDYNSKEGCQPYSIQSCEHHVNGSRPDCSSLPERTPFCRPWCTNSEYKTNFFWDHYKIGGVEYYKTPQDAQKSIMTEGSIEASFNVYEDFVTYKSGVYQHVTGEFMGGHAVRVVGWGEENGVPYWLVANSWNTDWGDNGWFKIKRGTNECGFEDDLVAGGKRS